MREFYGELRNPAPDEDWATSEQIRPQVWRTATS